MRQTFALLAIGMILLVAWAIIVQTARAMARARIRRRRRLLRLCSVVDGTPPASPDYELSLSQPQVKQVPPRIRADRLYAIGEFAAAAEILARHARG